MFTGHFAAWDAAKSTGDPYARKVMDAKAALQEYDKTWTLEELKQKPPQVPPGKLDEYLNPSEYQAVFGMSRDEYLGQPAWKRSTMKKKAGLY